MPKPIIELKIYDPAGPTERDACPLSGCVTRTAPVEPQVVAFGPREFVSSDGPAFVSGTFKAADPAGTAAPPAADWDRFEGAAPGPAAGAPPAWPFDLKAGAVGGVLPRRPIRDRLRAGLVDAIQRQSPVPVGASDVEEALDEATRGRPLIEWLRDGGLQKLIEVVLAILKLAA